MNRNIAIVIAIAVIVIAIAGIAFALNASQPQPNSSPSPSSSSPASSPGASAFPTSSSNPTIPPATGSPSTTTSPSTSSQPTSPPSAATTSTPSATNPPGTTSTPSATSSATTPPTTTTPPPTTPTPTPTPSPTTPPSGITATFDFDTSTPATVVRQTSTAFTQTANGLTATFSSPSDSGGPAFTVQSHNSLLPTSITLTLFSSNYLYPNTVNHDRLDIRFGQNVNSVTLTFATIEYHDPGVGGTGSTIRLSAYLNSATSTPIKQVTATGTEEMGASYPEGTITLTSTGQPFNLVEIDLPTPAQGATGFIIDNIVVTTA